MLAMVLFVVLSLVPVSCGCHYNESWSVSHITGFHLFLSQMSGKKMGRAFEEVEEGKERRGAAGRRGDYTSTREVEKDEEDDEPEYIKRFKAKSRECCFYCSLIL